MTWSFNLVRVTRLELVRHGHTPLKRACLPIPAHSLDFAILPQLFWFVNINFHVFATFYNIF